MSSKDLLVLGRGSIKYPSLFTKKRGSKISKICPRGLWIPPIVQSIENERMMQLFRTRDDLTPHTGTEVFVFHFEKKTWAKARKKTIPWFILDIQLFWYEVKVINVRFAISVFYDVNPPRTRLRCDPLIFLGEKQFYVFRLLKKNLRGRNRNIRLHQYMMW